jgi:glycosyltransferase involved in cell wall biosynthesis
MFSACAVIPVYNHERTIAAVLAGVQKSGLHVFLIDDGCNAQCSAELRRLSHLPRVTLLRHERNSGKGAAVCTGMRAAYQAGFTHALQVDADGQHALGDVPAFLDAAQQHSDRVICGRPVFDASMPSSRYYGRYLTHALVWLETLSFDIRDSMCGFRLYPLAPVHELLRSRNVGPRMDFDTDIIVRLYWRGVRMQWLDTKVVYPVDGVSHFRMVLDNVRMISLHVRLVLGMLVRAPLLVRRKVAHFESDEVTR